MAASKPNNQKSSAAVAVVALMIVAAIAAMAILFPRLIRTNDDIVNVNLPLIRTMLRSSTDGQDYSVQALFSVEMDPELRRDISDSVLRDTITDIINGMDADDIRAPEGISNVNQYVTDELNKRLAAETETSVFAYDLAVGGDIQFSEPAGTGSNDVMKGLFENME